uniref:Complement component c3b, tandem duplicate 2 n=1 Tax=Oryzias latipes TaxID=8090 RepID=A0A3P9LX36_ORYLA
NLWGFFFRFVSAEKYWERFTIITPDLLRTDSQENIYLEAEGLSNPVFVSIEIKDFNKISMLFIDNATLNQDNGFQVLKSIQLSSNFLNREEKKNKFVYLTVSFQGYHTEERVLMVSFHSGYIFIQTDKPIYKPGDNVRFRTFVSSPFFKAFDSSITIDITNSDGVVVKQITRTRAVKGVIADTFPLSEIANEGTWQVTAKFDHWQQNTFTSPFQVKKYVLPAFNVTLTPTKSFISLDDSELVVEITARYLFGEPVEGTAYVVFGVKMNQEMKRLPSVKQLSDLDGGRVSLSIEELKAAYPDPETLVGHSVYVKASVLTKTGSDLVEAEKTGVKIVKSPYVISFTDSPKYFKPGLPLDLTIEVSNHDGSPARNVQVKISQLDVPLIASAGTARASINMPDDQQPQTITVETIQADLRPDQQARTQITLQPYVAFNQHQQNYLYISTGSKSVSVGDRVSLDISVKMSIQENRKLVKHITYLVLSNGKILKAERVDVTDRSVTNVGLVVTSEMMPSFRVVAFFSLPWVGREEVVSDSVWIDVVDSCIGGLTVGSGDSTPRTLAPGQSVRFKIRGDPGSKVNLVAVDNSVYLLNKDRLTQKKIWDVVEHGDMGCTRGGGRDASGVFVDAGLLFSSSAGFKTQTRQVLHCPGRARRRRSAEQLKRKQQLENHYKEKLERRCCKDGLREIPMPYSCTRRSLYITEGWECMRAFRYCCSTYRGQEFNTEIPTTPPPMTTAPPTTTHPPTTSPLIFYYHFSFMSRSVFNVISTNRLCYIKLICKKTSKTEERKKHLEMTVRKKRITLSTAAEEEEDEEWEEVDESQIYLRHKFFESWLWMDIDLPSKAERDGLASLNLDSALPDSITEWGVLAISSSPHTGFCVAQPYNIQSWKHFFVDLRLPYSVARFEQLEIKAVVHNYGYDALQARVVLMKTEKICSVAFKDKHTQEVTVPASSSVAVHYTIVPLEVGNLPLEVTAFAKGMVGSDRTQKSLRVVLEGVEKTKVQTVVLNPSAHGGSQTVHVGKIEMDAVVPNSVPETFINVRGNVLADSIDNSISEDSLGALIQMPGGCVEQNLATITLPLIATLYLDRTGSWESVGVQRKAEALGYIKRGYENQLEYRKTDGSYPPYSRQEASTWITAYVVKVFSMAYSVISINKNQICDPLIYLVNNKLRQRVGMYKEDNPVYSTTMTGGLRGGDPEITLTAFVHIALSEAKRAGIVCTSSGVSVETANEWTTRYLKKALLTKGRRPYTVAIASYALALQEAPPKLHEAPPNLHEALLQAAAPDSSHWPDRENFLFQLEATGYALLTLVRLGRMEDAAAPFKWLNNQRRRGGGFGSTQSTMVVLQALSEYMINKPREDTNLDVDIKIAGRRDLRYRFNPDTAYAARSSKLPAGHEFDVVVKGSGEGILEVVTYYNQLLEVDEKKPCNDFDLSVNVEESTEKHPADVIKTYKISIKVRALGPRDVRMVVLDISLPTGFTPENSDLEMLSNSVDRYINNFQIVDNLSERGSLIIHLFKVSHKEPEIVIFRLQQNFKVGLLQPSSVTVYEYYNPDHRCSRIYTPKEDREELTQICKDNVCRCAQSDCCVSKADSDTFPNKEREIFACNGLHHVFQVKVLSISQDYYDKYEMEIMQVIKLGELEDRVEVGQRRLFMSHGGCREDLQLKEGSQYLLMGPKEDQWRIDPDTNRFIYTLGKNTWMERWPSPAECSSMQDKCRSLSAAVNDLSESGCRM